MSKDQTSAKAIHGGKAYNSQMLNDVLVRATGRYLPERVFKNEEFSSFLETNDEWIRERTGIHERRFAAPGEQASDMALAAATQCLERGGLDPDDLDLIILATITPDTVFPATANWLQGKLGNTRAWSFDINAACSGFLYALSVATNSLRLGAAKFALVVGVERMSAILDMTKRDHCVLFGDGAACLLLEAVAPADNPQGYGVREFYTRSDGSLAKCLMQQSGGSNQPPTIESVMNHEHYISMDGRRVYRHAIRRMYESVMEILDRAKVDKEEIDWFVPHQANARIIEATQIRLEVPKEKVYINVNRYGNTTAATLPICLDELSTDGKLEAGHKVVLFTFGSGFTWGSCYLVWGGCK